MVSNPTSSSSPPAEMETSQPATTLNSTWVNPPLAPHPEASEIVQIFEALFDDDYIRADAHLLALTGGEGNGPVTIHEMLCTFKKLRRFKPMSAVRDALKMSLYLEVVDDSHVKRRYPLTKPPFVKPLLDERKHEIALILEKSPWLTKGMLKTTGFELGPVQPPSPEDYEQEHQHYNPEDSFIARIETAISRFAARGKKHQGVLTIFESFLRFGGISSGPQQFANSYGPKLLAREGLDKEEIAPLTQHYAVSDMVKNDMNEDLAGDPKWIVDFDALAKAFLSSHFPACFNWCNEAEVMQATNVLRRFYTYLVHFDVCPEYAEQLAAAKNTCDEAEQELKQLAMFDRKLPGHFNAACSMLFGGQVPPCNDWKSPDEMEDGSLETDEAVYVFKAGMFAYASDDQLKRIDSFAPLSTLASVIFEGMMGLEVVEIQDVSAEARGIYDDDRFVGTIVQPLSKIKCIYWENPAADPTDIPAYVAELHRGKTYEFLVEQQTLKHCRVGMKMDVTVKELDLGVMWLSSIETVYPTFFTWLANERIYDWKEPGPPKEWMNRANERKTVKYEGEGGEYDEGGEDLSDDGPD